MEKSNTGWFPKGHTPWNKGVAVSPEVYAKCVATMFKPGHVPANHREIGAERVNADGYTEVKVAEPNKWKLKHRVIWEQAHGEIPKGHCIVFLDQNKSNCVLENLECVWRGDAVKISKRRNWSKEPNVTRVAIALARLENAINEISKIK